MRIEISFECNLKVKKKFGVKCVKVPKAVKLEIISGVVEK